LDEDESEDDVEGPTEVVEAVQNWVEGITPVRGYVGEDGRLLDA
jgi:hypothetical protein